MLIHRFPAATGDEFAVAPRIGGATGGGRRERQAEEKQEAKLLHGGSLISIVSRASLMQIPLVKGASKFQGKSLKGQFLLDGGKLRGSYFHRSVVLLCHHDDEGAFGLVINRASDNQVGDLLLADLPVALKEQKLFAGGPVQPAALSFLHHDGFIPDANVLPNLNLGHSLEELVDIGESYSSTQQVKIFAGYAGWSPGQLEDELKRNSWVTFPATPDLVFHAPPDQLWPTIMKQLGWRQRLLADTPEDLSWN